MTQETEREITQKTPTEKIGLGNLTGTKACPIPEGTDEAQRQLRHPKNGHQTQQKQTSPTFKKFKTRNN